MSKKKSAIAEDRLIDLDWPEFYAAVKSEQDIELLKRVLSREQAGQHRSSRILRLTQRIGRLASKAAQKEARGL